MDRIACVDVPELPLYGTQPRVRCKNLRGPWQEVELRVYSYEEIDRKQFMVTEDTIVIVPKGMMVERDGMA